MPHLKVNGHQLFYETLGNEEAEETIAFFNGVMTTTTSWAIYYPLFEKLNYRIFLHDFKGQMKSDKPQGPYTFKEHAEDAKEMMDRLGIKKVHLISTSYGSEVAIRFAIDFPDYVKSLTIIEGASEIDETTKLFVEGWKNLAEEKNGEKFFWGAVPSLYYNDFVEKNKEFLGERAKLLNDIGDEYFNGQITLYNTYIQDTNMTEELHKIQSPTFIIWGEKDVLTPRKYSEQLAKHIPHTEFVIVPESGHVAIFEKAETIKSMILGFVLKNSENLI